MHRLLLLLAIAALDVPARAQGFNVDCGLPGTAPSTSYGAASGQAGAWNVVDSDFHADFVNLDGSQSTVHLDAGGLGTYTCDDPSTSGDDEALMDDYEDGFFSGSTYQVTGLAPGAYDVYAYGFAPCHTTLPVYSGNLIGLVGSWDGEHPFTNSGWSGSFVEGENYSKARFVAFNGTITIDFQGGAYGGLAGFQIVPVDPPATTFCAYSTIGGFQSSSCPCTHGAQGHGCASSFNAQGAEVLATGANVVSGDTLTLSVTGTSASVVTFFQGATAASTQNGVSFGDGVRCTGGTLVRIGQKFAAAGMAQYPGPGDLPISTKGFVGMAGGMRTYQVAYRNAVSYCTTATINFTNGLVVFWRP